MFCVTDPMVDEIAKKLEAEIKSRASSKPAFSPFQERSYPMDMTVHEVVAFVLNGGEVL